MSIVSLRESMYTRLGGGVKEKLEGPELWKYTQGSTNQLEPNNLINIIRSDFIHREAILAHNLIKEMQYWHSKPHFKNRHRDSYFPCWWLIEDIPLLRILHPVFRHNPKPELNRLELFWCWFVPRLHGCLYRSRIKSRRRLRKLNRIKFKEQNCP